MRKWSKSKWIFVSSLCVLFTACANETHYAPVMEISLNASHPNANHRVQYASRLASQPTVISILKEKTISSTERFDKSAKKNKKNNTNDAWIWPVKGSILNAFSSAHKGINIAGDLGDPILATAAGKVVYSGDGLRGYGNLIILKHQGAYFSVYAHNQSIFVKEGEWVRQGQKIAAMGNTGTHRVMLHFEIRKNNQAVNPVSLLNVSLKQGSLHAKK